MGFSILSINALLNIISFNSAFFGKQTSVIVKTIGRSGKEVSNYVKEITQTSLEAGKTIDNVSNTLHIPRSTVGSLKKRTEQRGLIENIP